MKLAKAILISSFLFAGGCCATWSVEKKVAGYTQRNPVTKERVKVSPQPAYRALLPFALAFDVATSPVQVPVILYMMLAP